MRSSRPLVSVLLPVRDAAGTVGETLRSLADQTFADFEVLVVDDGSRDRTAAAVTSVGDPRVRLLRLDRPRGIAQALNQAAAEGRGDLLARQDAGDVSEPRRLEREVAALEADSDLGAVSTWYRARRHDGGVEEMRLPVSHQDIAETAVRLRHVPFCHAGALIRADVFRKAGGYRLFPAAQDQDLWWRLLERTRLANVPETLYEVRWDAAGVSVSRRVSQFWSAHAAYLLARHRADGGVDPLGSSPSREAVAAFVTRTRRAAPREVRRELAEKLYNLACAAWSRGARRAGLRLQWHYLSEGGDPRRLLAYWIGRLRRRERG